jgi:hypothetical protein
MMPQENYRSQIFIGRTVSVKYYIYSLQNVAWRTVFRNGLAQGPRAYPFSVSLATKTQHADIH